MVTQVTEISTPPTPADPPGEFEQKAAKVWSELHQAVPQMNQQADEIEQIGADAQTAKDRAIQESDAALGYRNETRTARDAALPAAVTATDMAAQAMAAKEHAEVARDDAQAAAQAAVNRVAKTSDTGAAILPSGPASERPDPADYAGKFLIRGGEHGQPEYYDSTANSWVTFGGGSLYDINKRLSRAALVSGEIPADGQQVSLIELPQFVQGILNGTSMQPTVSDATWLANPDLQTSHYSRGDGASFIRVPNFNGAGGKGLGSMYFAGDLGGSRAGTAVMDALLEHGHRVEGGNLNQGNSAGYHLGIAYTNTAPGDKTGSGLPPNQWRDDFVTKVVGARVADENRVKTIYVCWAIRAFHGAINTGVVDAAQLATQLAVVKAEVEEIKSQVNALKAIRHAPEALWTGSTGNVVELTLSREVLEGELLVLKHSTAGSGLTVPQVYFPSVSHQVDGGTYLAFSAATAYTGCVLRKPAIAGGPSIMKMLSYTSGYGISGIYAIKQVD